MNFHFKTNWFFVCLRFLKCLVLTSPSLGMMLVRWTTSRWADWETRESDDREMMWSQIPAKVLHCRQRQKKQRVGQQKNDSKRQKGDRDRKFLKLVLVCRERCDFSWRRWNRHHFIRLFYIPTAITPSHKLFPVTVCPQACPQDTPTNRTMDHQH